MSNAAKSVHFILFFCRTPVLRHLGQTKFTCDQEKPIGFVCVLHPPSKEQYLWGLFFPLLRAVTACLPLGRVHTTLYDLGGHFLDFAIGSPVKSTKQSHTHAAFRLRIVNGLNVISETHATVHRRKKYKNMYWKTKKTALTNSILYDFFCVGLFVHIKRTYVTIICSIRRPQGKS